MNGNPYHFVEGGPKQADGRDQICFDGPWQEPDAAQAPPQQSQSTPALPVATQPHDPSPRSHGGCTLSGTRARSPASSGGSAASSSTRAGSQG